MRRWSFLKTMLPVFLSSPEVSEVILCDETGEDAEAARAAFGSNPKLKIHVNDHRLGIYQNKKKVLQMAKGWTALLDSDNIFPEEWFEFVKELDFSDKKRMYGSADFKSLETDTGKVTTPCKEFSGLVLSKDNWNTFLHRDKCFFLLNEGNFILHADAAKFLPPTRSEDLQAADAIFMLWNFVKNGYTLEYTGPEYIHLIHSDSSWLQTEKESTKVLMETRWYV
jgi:glycosyltransferase involved in cell wall biosynthesis